jgi:hypothetical protein
MIIYIYLNLVKLYQSHWKGPKVGQNATLSRISRYMTYDRFTGLRSRLRFDDPDTIEVDMPGPYYKVPNGPMS